MGQEGIPLSLSIVIAASIFSAVVFVVGMAWVLVQAG
jgi:hypothetical protein